MHTISLLEMLKNGVHFGHQAKNWHPKMKSFIFTVRGGIHIIDLEKTAEYLQYAVDFITDKVANGGKVLFITTKRQAQEIVKQAASSVDMPAVTERWIGGTLTNFDNIALLVRHLKELRDQRDSGEFEKYTKLEQLKKTEEIANLEKSVGGIENLSKLPDVVFIVDIKKEKTALREARKKKIPVVAMVDTNVNPDLVDYPIPANDDATKSITLLVQAISEAVVAGQKKQKDATEEKKVEKSKETKKEEVK